MRQIIEKGPGSNMLGTAEVASHQKEYRCPVCKRLLMRGKIIAIETRCPKCKRIVRLKD